MRQEAAMDVLSRLKRRLAPLVGQNALFFKNTNSVIMLKSYHILFQDLSVIFVDNFASFNRKVYSELDRTTSKIMININGGLSPPPPPPHPRLPKKCYLLEKIWNLRFLWKLIHYIIKIDGAWLILSAMLRYQDVIDMLPQQQRNYQLPCLVPWQNGIPMSHTVLVVTVTIYDVIVYGPWKAVYAMLRQFFN